MTRYGTILLAAFTLAACGPEVGSPDWCKKMMETQQEKWSPKDGATFAEKCQDEVMKSLEPMMRGLLGDKRR